MKFPVLPTIASALCVVLSLWLMIQTVGIRGGREALLRQQEANRKLQQEVEKQNEEAQRQTKVYQGTQGIAQIRQGELQRQQQVVENGVQVAQKYLPSVVKLIGYYATKNNNAKLRELLSRNGFPSMTPKEVSEIDSQKAAAQGPAPAPAPRTP